MITISIDVTQLDKTRFKEVKRRSGEVARFCELVLIETPDSEFGDFMVKQGVTKEEREQRIQMPILGNGKRVGGSSGKPQGEHPSRPKPAPAKRPPVDPDLDAPEDDIPF